MAEAAPRPPARRVFAQAADLVRRRGGGLLRAIVLICLALAATVGGSIAVGVVIATCFNDQTVGYVGTAWIVAVLLWWEARSATKPWIVALRPALAGLSIGLTPQICFLIAYNLMPRSWSAQTHAPAAVLLGCETALLRLHLWLRPLEEHGLLWLALVIAIGGTASLLYDRPGVLAGSVKAFARVKQASYVLVIATSFTVASSVPAGSYQPDARLRLAAQEAEELADGIRLLMAEQLAAELRAGNTAPLVRLARAVEEDRADRGEEGANLTRAERAGVKALAARQLAGLADRVAVPERAEQAEPGDPVDAYVLRRRETERVREREEAAKEALSSAIVEASGLGAFGAGAIGGALQGYLSETIDEAAEFLADQLLSRAAFTDIVRRDDDPSDDIRHAVRPLAPEIIGRMIVTGGAAEAPAMPEEFRAARDEDVREQSVEAQRRSQQEAVGRRR
jgi:hypothetical protein